MSALLSGAELLILGRIQKALDALEAGDAADFRQLREMLARLRRCDSCGNCGEFSGSECQPCFELELIGERAEDARLERMQ